MAGTRRPPMKVNPVTGEMTKVERSSTEGMHRDGSLMLSDKYIHAARDAGLGAGGAFPSLRRTRRPAQSLTTSTKTVSVRSLGRALRSGREGARASRGR